MFSNIKIRDNKRLYWGRFVSVLGVQKMQWLTPWANPGRYHWSVYPAKTNWRQRFSILEYSDIAESWESKNTLLPKQRIHCTNDGLQPNSGGLQSNSDVLHPSSDGFQPSGDGPNHFYAGLKKPWFEGLHPGKHLLLATGGYAMQVQNDITNHYIAGGSIYTHARIQHWYIHIYVNRYSVRQYILYIYIYIYIIWVCILFIWDWSLAGKFE